MELLGIASILGKLAMTEAAKAAVAGVKNQLHPDKMERILKNAIESAQAAQPEMGGIFFKCQPKAAKEFLEKFFHSGEVLKQLQKPLQDDGKPDVDVLVEAFDRSAKQHSEMKNYIPETLRSWMETFVESYFEQLQGICFQVAKEQYLKQLARRVDDVKFVGNCSTRGRSRKAGGSGADFRNARCSGRKRSVLIIHNLWIREFE